MRALITFVLMICWVLCAMVLVFPFWLLGLEALRRHLSWGASRVLVRVIGLKVQVVGEMATQRPLLVVSNHSSYADVLALGAAMPLSFTPKSDIRWWPLVGWCCALTGCVFIERKAHKLPHNREHLLHALAKGRVVCLFAEGTTNDGTHLLPFKSGFFSVAETMPALTIQPVAVRYRSWDGVPLDAAGRARVAWFGDGTLLPHLLRFLSAREIVAEIQLLPPLQAAGGASRKQLAQRCEQMIKAALPSH